METKNSNGLHLLSSCEKNITARTSSIKHFFTYKTHAKLRWVNKRIADVLSTEFTMASREYYIDALKVGAITVNGNIVLPSYHLKHLDVILHTVHLHEPVPPIIPIIKEEADYFVLNKPPGIPVHPVGGYFYYSVTKALFGDTPVGCINRLDIPVSGVLLITHKNNHNAHDMLGEAHKIYIAKVRGEFPKEISVDKSIGTRNGRIHCVMDGGKPSKTEFRRLSYKNGFSIVQCRPITGRTHQIRIHISYIGFPIINDILYNGVCSDTTKGYCNNASISNNSTTTCNNSSDISNINGCNTSIEDFEDKKKYQFIIKSCKGENNRSFKIKDSYICLHAWKYTYNGVEYEAPLPDWAYL